MPQNGRPAHKRTHKRPPQSQTEEPAEASNTAWQRSSGGFSGAAKKEYLKWKRQQKTARGHTSSDEGPATNQVQVPALPQQQVDTQHAAAPGADLDTTSHLQRQRRDVQHFAAAPLEEAMRPLEYRRLMPVPAAPFISSVPAATSASTAANSSSSTRRPQGDAAADVPRHLETSVQGLEACMTRSEVTYMPVLNPGEVGFTPEGFSLTVPTRPKWQGVVSTAEELHRLEETEFAAWQSALTHTATQLLGLKDLPASSEAAAAAGISLSTKQQLLPHPPHTSNQAQATQQDLQQQQQVCVMPTHGLLPGLGPISPYEGRLEFWRQLWRTLEMSDVICMVVDVRNPLLHFSHALYRHISSDHKLPLLLLLNKCDLVPAAAAAAWQHWLQQQLPGVTVIPVSAAQDHAEVTAKAVLTAVLQQHITRDGVCLSVQDIIKHSVDELYEQSVLRNTHAKSHVQKGSVRCFAAEPEDLSCKSADHMLPAALPATTSAEASHLHAPNSTRDQPDVSSSSSSDDDDWSLRARIPPRRQRNRRIIRSAASAQQSHLVSEPLLHPGSQAQGSHEGCHISSNLPVAATQDSSEEASLGAHDSACSDTDDPDDDRALQYAADVDEQLADLTLERRLSSTSAPQRCTPGTEAAEQSCSEAEGARSMATTPSEGGPLADALTEAARSGRRSRPVVIGLLGEPNVGKSSMMNALLGSHRVAVSAHPGRTKHYQTHYMCDQLVLVDCPGVVCPRLHVTPALQVLFGSSPIASCREPYAAVRYLAESSWPRVQDVLKLHTHHLSLQQQQAVAAEAEQQQQRQRRGPRQSQPVVREECQKYPVPTGACGSGAETGHPGTCTAAAGPGSPQSNSVVWSPYTLCEALAAKRNWLLKRSGRLDTYRAANWLLRAALAGQGGIGLAYMPPGSDACAGHDVVCS